MNSKVNFDEVMEALSMLEEVTGIQYEIRLKSDQWATLNKQDSDDKITTFRWEQPGKDTVGLGDRIMAYIANMAKEHLATELAKLQKIQEDTQRKITKTSNLLEALGKE